jgi:hypothetical protein
MKQLQEAITNILREITTPEGFAATDRFPSLRSVDAKVTEFTLLLDQLPASAQALRTRFDRDDDFQANSRRVRLEALSNYCNTVLRFLAGGILQSERKPQPGPALTVLTGSVPALELVIQRRWLEAQTTWFAGAHLSSVVLMGSILEALLLSRVLLAPAEAGRSQQAPKDRSGNLLKFHDWKLTHLIDVAVDLRWLRLDRGKFSHALRESRNIVHPYQQATSGADFDEGTCRTCWQVLNSATEDLIASV